jgi:hypothetical protein
MMRDPRLLLVGFERFLSLRLLALEGRTSRIPRDGGFILFNQMKKCVRNARGVLA